MKRQATAFIGHGSPMNAIQKNEFTKPLHDLGAGLAKASPKGVIVVSAHWVTAGQEVLGSEKPRTIHDFGGFPKELYDVQYPAAGDPELARELAQSLGDGAKVTSTWGLDHGAWSVLTHLFPKADTKTVMVSLEASRTPMRFFQLGRALRAYRDKGYLLLGSGNLVHNLRRMNPNPAAPAASYATSFDTHVKTLVEAGQLEELAMAETVERPDFTLAHPTAEHMAPLWVIAGTVHDGEKVDWAVKGFQHESISMRSAVWGA